VRRIGCIGLIVCGGCGETALPSGDAQVLVDAAVATDLATVEADVSDGGSGNNLFQKSMPAVLFGVEGANEDPFPLRDGDTLYVVWYSTRFSGQPDLAITKTTDGKTWTFPTRLTTSADADYYPSLYKVNGKFELVWFRQGMGGRNLLFNRADDPLAFDPANEIEITIDPGADDWVPTMVVAPGGERVVYFASVARSPNHVSDLFRVQSSDGGAHWTAPSRVDELDAPMMHDDLPAAIRASDGSYFMTWVRQDTVDRGDGSGGYLPWVNPSADLFYATSADAISWSAPVNFTASEGNDWIDTFPSLAPFPSGTTHVYWLSGQYQTQTTRVYDIALADLEGSGLGLGMWAIPGYSPHFSSTPTDGIALTVWVEGAANAQQIHYQFINDPFE
jgi:hypothetical protein